MRSKRLPGLAVVTIDSGEQIGRVQRLVIDPQRKSVAALLVSARGSFRKQLLPIEAVFAMGTHAVTVRNKEALGPLKGEGSASALARGERIDLLGSPVITARGELLGTVRDFEVTDRGEITALYVSGGLVRSLAGREASIPGELLLALGKDAAVVDERAALLHLGEPAGAKVAAPRERKGEQKPLRERLALLLPKEKEDLEERAAQTEEQGSGPDSQERT